MKDLRIEVTDEGGGLYLAIDPDGVWSKTSRPDNFITIDWDRQGRVIGVELVGSAANRAISALVKTIAEYPAADQESVRAALSGLTQPTTGTTRT
jgi:uncharacterized protein YuzE